MHFKVMNVFCRFRTSVSSVCRRSVLLEQKYVFRNICSSHRGRSYSVCVPEHFTRLASCQHQYHRATQRFYSEDYEQRSRNPKTTGGFEEESCEVDDSNSEEASPSRSSQTFTLDVLVSLLRQENAVDICVIKIPEQIKYADYFIVVSGLSPRHLSAMASYTIKVYKFLRKDGDPHVKIEGKDAEDWMCIDFGNIVVHFMLPETREVYELEKLWTLRMFDEQLKSIPAEILPEDFVLDTEASDK